MKKRLLEISVLVTAALLSMAPGCGCDRNKGGFLFDPTGEKPVPATGSVTGRLDFGTGMFEQSLILMARVKDPNCVSAYNSITITGTNTDPIFDVGTSPALTQIAPCVWVDTLTLVSSRIGSELFRWKFVTNNTFDSPPDYSTADAGSEDGLENILAFAGPGSPDLDADVPPGFLDRPIVCTIDETSDPANYKFQLFADAPAAFTSTVDGSFSVTNLVPGTYNLRVRPPTGPPVDMMVEVGNTNTDLGTIQIGAPAGSITGTLAYGPTIWPDLINPPYPEVDVRVYTSGTLIDQLTSSRQSRDFTFTDLPAADYVVVANANMYKPDSVMGTVSVGLTTVDTLGIAGDNGQLASAMHVAGDWNGFVIDATSQMSLALAQVTPVCATCLVWEFTTPQPIAPGTYNFKFVTDNSFDNPTDYGGDESTALAVPVTGSPTSLVAGSGTAIKIQVTTSATFKFTLDERRQSFTIATVPAPRSVAERMER